MKENLSPRPFKKSPNLVTLDGGRRNLKCPFALNGSTDSDEKTGIEDYVVLVLVHVAVAVVVGGHL